MKNLLLHFQAQKTHAKNIIILSLFEVTFGNFTKSSFHCRHDIINNIIGKLL